MLSTGPIRAALDRGMIDCIHWTIVYRALYLPLNYQIVLSQLWSVRHTCRTWGAQWHRR